STHRPPGYDTGTRDRRTHDDLASPEAADHIMVQGAPFTQRNAHHVSLGVLGCLANRFWYFARLSRAVAHPPLPITNHDKGGKAEPPSALDHLGHAIDADQLLDEFTFIAAAFPIAAVAPVTSVTTCHSNGSPRRKGRPRGRHRPGP